MKRILVTGAGGPAAVNFIRSLRAADERMWIAGCDVDRYHLEWPQLDAAYEAPRCDDPGYIDFLNGLIEREEIAFVHPQPDVEVRVISARRCELGAPVFLPGEETVALLQDKHRSGERWADAGIARAPSLLVRDRADLERAAAELGLPFWLRATEGAGGIGSTPVEDVAVAVHWMEYWRLRGRAWSWVAQELLPGANLAFTSLWREGELVCSQVRERLEYIYPYLAPSGVTGTPVNAVTRDRPDVDEIATAAVLAVDAHANGVFCVDLKEDSEGVPRPTEINCGRFFTTSYFFTAAGVNIPHLYVRLAFGEELSDVPAHGALPAGLHWVRHIDCPPVLCREETLASIPLQASPPLCAPVHG
jgi:predicted ATP-grasp superfamily ATP-dependent carboligase